MRPCFQIFPFANKVLTQQNVMFYQTLSLILEQGAQLIVVSNTMEGAGEDHYKIWLFSKNYEIIPKTVVGTRCHFEILECRCVFGENIFAFQRFTLGS